WLSKPYESRNRPKLILRKARCMLSRESGWCARPDPLFSAVTPRTLRALLNRSIRGITRRRAMENPADVERRARALVMLSMAMYPSAVESQRLSRRRLLMVGAMVAKLANLRRSRLRSGAPAGSPAIPVLDCWGGHPGLASRSKRAETAASTAV